MHLRNGLATRLLLCIAITLCLFQHVNAWALDIQNLEISALAGFSEYNISNTHVLISPFETDNDLIQNSTSEATWKLGVGYYFFEEQLKRRRYLNHFLLEMNVYQTSTTLNGEVWQYELPIFNNYNFQATTSSTRWMLDVKPHLFSWHQLTPYAIVGLGLSHNALSYDETISQPDIAPDSALSLPQHGTNHLAWEAGMGLRFMVSDHIGLIAEYLYADLNHVAPAHGNTTVNFRAPPNFLLQNQSILLGLSLKC